MTVVPGQLSLLPGCLSELDRAVLSFGCAHHLQGWVDARVQQELGVTATRYCQLLTALLDRPEAAEVAPILVGELRALRDRRRRYWAHPTLAAPPDAPVVVGDDRHADGQRVREVVVANNEVDFAVEA